MSNPMPVYLKTKLKIYTTFIPHRDVKWLTTVYLSPFYLHYDPVKVRLRVNDWQNEEKGSITEVFSNKHTQDWVFLISKWMNTNSRVKGYKISMTCKVLKMRLGIQCIHFLGSTSHLYVKGVFSKLICIRLSHKLKAYSCVH